MAIDAFIKFEGGQNKIKGESQDSQMKAADGWSTLEAVSFGGSNAASIGTGSSGGGSGKVDFSDFTLSKIVDNSSPQFFMAMCAGDHYDKVTIAMRKAAGGAVAPDKPYLQYCFALVYVTSMSTSIASAGEPMESISFAYGAMQIQYTPQDAQGKLGTANPAQWSKVLNKASLAVA